MVLEAGMFISQGIWLWRVRHVRREAKKLGMTYDEYVDSNLSKKLSRTESLETIDLESGDAVPVEPISSPEKCVPKPSKDRAPQHMLDTSNTDAMNNSIPTMPEKAVIPNHNLDLQH